MIFANDRTYSPTSVPAILKAPGIFTSPRDLALARRLLGTVRLQRPLWVNRRTT